VVIQLAATLLILELVGVAVVLVGLDKMPLVLRAMVVMVVLELHLQFLVLH
jgi:hypothetical protein